MRLVSEWTGRHRRILLVLGVLCAAAAGLCAWSLWRFGLWPPEWLDLLGAVFLVGNLGFAAHAIGTARRLAHVSVEVHPDHLELVNLRGRRTLARDEIERLEIARSGDLWSWQTREQAIWAVLRSGERVELQALRNNGWLSGARRNARGLERHLADLG